MITHRYENLDGMDRIYKLEHGQLIASGCDRGTACSGNKKVNMCA